MKKILLWSLGGILVLGLVAVIVLASSLGSIVKTAVNSFGPKLTGTKVELAGASISPLSGSGTLTGLTVGNPSGWSKEHAFALGKVHLSVAPFSLMGDHIVIDELLIDAPEFDYETKLTDSNIAQLQANIEKIVGAGTAVPAGKSGQPVKFEVKKFRLTNAKVSVGVAGAPAITVPMPDISFDNLGSDKGGITPDQLVGVIMKQVSTGVIVAGKDAVLKAGTAVIGGAKDTIKATTDAAKNAMGGIKDLIGGGKK
ncbi:MAG: hypothetical protein WCL04_00310 [Verrucomicrobiota bacterium]